MNWAYYLVNNTDQIMDLFDSLPDTPSTISITICYVMSFYFRCFVAEIRSDNWQIIIGLSIRSGYCYIFLENLYIYLDVFVVSFHLCLGTSA